MAVRPLGFVMYSTCQLGRSAPAASKGPSCSAPGGTLLPSVTCTNAVLAAAAGTRLLSSASTHLPSSASHSMPEGVRPDGLLCAPAAAGFFLALGAAAAAFFGTLRGGASSSSSSSSSWSSLSSSDHSSSSSSSAAADATAAFSATAAATRRGLAAADMPLLAMVEQSFRMGVIRNFTRGDR